MEQSNFAATKGEHNLLFKCVKYFHVLKDNEVACKEVDVNNGKFASSCRVTTSRSILDVAPVQRESSVIDASKCLMFKWRSGGEVIISAKFGLVNSTEKCGPTTWWQNNGLSDLWPTINKSCFQAPILQTGVLRVRPRADTYVPLFISAFPFRFWTWQRVTKKEIPEGMTASI